jgi:hypothetical protein
MNNTARNASSSTCERTLLNIVKLRYATVGRGVNFWATGIYTDPLIERVEIR